MSKKPDATLTGAFVLGGIVLLVAALFAFGSGDLFKEKRRWVTYFEGSVGGLAEGAPVNFRGVRVGTVTQVDLQLDPQKLIARIPVYFELDPSRVHWVGGSVGQMGTEQAAAAGVRAKLSMQSLVTGQMQVELDLMPETPANLVGQDPKVPEIASVPSEFDVLKSQLSELPLQDVLASVDRTLRSIDQVVTSREVRDSLSSLASSLSESQKLLAGLNEDARPLLRQLTSTAQAIQQTSEKAGNTLQSIEGDIRQASTALVPTLRSADRALQQARTTLSSIDGIVADDTNSRADLETTLQNLARASDSLRGFADRVERNPNALVVGR